MYVIGTNTINGVIATDQQETYEADALLTDETSDKWRANGSTATVTVGVSGGSAVLIAATNATTISVSKADHIGAEWDDSTSWGSLNSASWQTYSGSSLTVSSGQDAYGYYHAWASYTEDSDDHVLIITLSAPSGSSVEAGAIYAGYRLSINDFRVGLGMGVLSKSVVYPLGRRSEYIDYESGDVRRTWDGSVIMKLSDWYDFMDAARVRGQKPLAWLLSENFTADRWIALAKFSSLPSAKVIAPNYVEVSFGLEEV